MADAPPLGPTDLLPARMLNEFAYCPPLFYLEWVQGEWRESYDTVEGRARHRRVQTASGAVPSAGEAAEEGAIHARSVLLSAERLGMIARIDLLEGEGKKVTSVDNKKGRKPDIPEGAYEPERIQVCAQGLILRENGYECDGGVVYYVESKERIAVPFDEAQVKRALTLLEYARKTGASGKIPPPLVDSSKCPRCSLVGICLPDEVQCLARPGEGELVEVRRLLPARDDALPLYVQEQGAIMSKKGELIEVRRGGALLGSGSFMEVSQVCLWGSVSVTPQCLRELCGRGIPVCHFSFGGWFYGITHRMTLKNVELRTEQFRTAEDEKRSAAIARRIVEGKIRNCRTMIRRNHPGAPEAALGELARLANLASEAESAEALLGLEGAAANVYFSHFSGMLKAAEGEDGPDFDFTARNRRPPKDPVNALLSFLHAVLAKEATVTLLSVGFDPYMGFYHRPKNGRPALALDLMEEFRPLVTDSAVITLVNNRELGPRDFVVRGVGASMTPEGKRRVLDAYERRMDSLVTHPIFGYSISHRRVLEVQARLLARHIAGEVPAYEPFCTR